MLFFSGGYLCHISVHCNFLLFEIICECDADILATTRLCSLQRGGTTPGGGSRVAQVPGTFRIALSNAAPTFPLAIRSLASTFTPKSHPKPRPSPRDPTSSPLLSLSRHRRRNRPSLSSPSHSPSLTPQKTHVPFFTYT